MATHHRKGPEEVRIVLGQNSDGSIDAKIRNMVDGIAAFGVQIDDSIQEIFDEVGKEAVKMVKANSPVNEKSPQKGRYKKGWVYERGKKVRGVTVSYIRNKTDPQLTHLLEFGHPIVRNGKVVGNADPIEHIGPVAEWVAEEANKRIQKAIGGN